MLEGLLTAATPLLLASLGALLTDLSGTLGICIEGFMILGAFFSWHLAGVLGSVFWGSLCTALLALPLGWGLARFSHKTAANPFITALALNLAAAALTESLSAAWFGTKGVLRNPAVSLPAPWKLPLIAPIPLAGPLLSGQSPFAYLALLCALILALLVGRTLPGLRLRAAGADPEAAGERGIRVQAYREWAWAAAAFLAALGGGALSFRVGAYIPGGVAGRGWIALAAVYLGFRRVGGVVLAALLFALVERIGMAAQIGGAVPATVLLGLPPALALILYTLSHVRFRRNSPLRR